MNGYINVTMLIKTKRGLRPFTFDVEDSDPRPDAIAVAGFLNEQGGSPELEGIEQLVRDINEIDRLAAEAGYPNVPFTGTLGRKTAPLFQRINPYFQKCQMVYTLGVPTRLGWREAVETKVESIPNAFILRAAVRGILKLLDECNFCKRWFVPRREDQKYCSNKCREKAFRGSDEGKAKRAAYMKRYREGLRRRDRESLRVGRKRKA